MATKNKDGYFRSTFYFNGKQYSSRGKTEKEAAQKAALKEQALKEGKIGVSQNMTVTRYCDDWLRVYRKPDNTEKSLATYKRHIKLMTDEIGNMKIKDVDGDHLQEIINSRAG